MNYTNQNDSINGLVEIEKINIRRGVVKFPQYERLYERATEIANQVSTMIVSEENIQGSKQTVAELKKITKRLTDKRIEIKKICLEPYEIFETQVKSIIGVIDTADAMVRSQVRELEERQREAKRVRLEEEWDLRAEKYRCTEYFTFNKWLRNEHLNKSMSFGKCEDDMIRYLEEHEEGLRFIEGQPFANEILIEYVHVDNVIKAMEKVRQRHEKLEEMKKTVPEDTEVVDKVTFIVTGTKDIELTKRLLQENKINYIER